MSTMDGARLDLALSGHLVRAGARASVAQRRSFDACCYMSACDARGAHARGWRKHA